eukprot:1780915-Prymnesium_polylepis.2
MSVSSCACTTLTCSASGAAICSLIRCGDASCALQRAPIAHSSTMGSHAPLAGLKCAAATRRDTPAASLVRPSSSPTAPPKASSACASSWPSETSYSGNVLVCAQGGRRVVPWREQIEHKRARVTTGALGMRDADMREVVRRGSKRQECVAKHRS